MSHFGIISPPVSGHLNPFCALGRELQSRGHRVTVFHMVDVEAKIRSEGLDFCVIGQSDHPLGSFPESTAQLGKLSGLAALQFTIHAIQRTTEMFCRDAPAAIQAAGIDMLLVDQTEPAGGTVAEHLGLPFVTICCALMINREAAVPPGFTAWGYRPQRWAKLRNQIGYAVSDRIMQPIESVLCDYRRRWKLPAIAYADQSFSQLAQISQQPPGFDFPRKSLPASFHYAGPFRNSSPQSVSFPYERLTGAPLVYTSLGTLQNTKAEVFRTIAAACEGLDIQLVLSHGGGLSEDAIATLPGNPLVVPYAPQVELLSKATLTIAHAGLNTVLDSLTHGVPLVTIPITYEQPAIAARLRWAGAGESIPLKQLTVERLRSLVQQVLQTETYRQKAQVLRASIQQAGGVKQAATLIEQAIAKLT
jgi:zeaxanthin glucosyltransferase